MRVLHSHFILHTKKFNPKISTHFYFPLRKNLRKKIQTWKNPSRNFCLGIRQVGDNFRYNPKNKKSFCSRISRIFLKTKSPVSEKQKRSLWLLFIRLIVTSQNVPAAASLHVEMKISEAWNFLLAYTRCLSRTS